MVCILEALRVLIHSELCLFYMTLYRIWILPRYVQLASSNKNRHKQMSLEEVRGDKQVLEFNINSIISFVADNLRPQFPTPPAQLNTSTSQC